MITTLSFSSCSFCSGPTPLLPIYVLNIIVNSSSNFCYFSVSAFLLFIMEWSSDDLPSDCFKLHPFFHLMSWLFLYTSNDVPSFLSRWNMLAVRKYNWNSVLPWTPLKSRQHYVHDCWCMEGCGHVRETFCGKSLSNGLIVWSLKIAGNVFMMKFIASFTWGCYSHTATWTYYYMCIKRYK